MEDEDEAPSMEDEAPSPPGSSLMKTQLMVSILGCSSLTQSDQKNMKSNFL